MKSSRGIYENKWDGTSYTMIYACDVGGNMLCGENENTAKALTQHQACY
jgi:hypothetical protein